MDKRIANVLPNLLQKIGVSESVVNYDSLEKHETFKASLETGEYIEFQSALGSVVAKIIKDGNCTEEYGLFLDDNKITLCSTLFNNDHSMSDISYEHYDAETGTLIYETNDAYEVGTIVAKDIDSIEMGTLS